MARSWFSGKQKQAIREIWFSIVPERTEQGYLTDRCRVAMYRNRGVLAGTFIGEPFESREQAEAAIGVAKEAIDRIAGFAD